MDNLCFISMVKCFQNNLIMKKTNKIHLFILHEAEKINYSTIRGLKTDSNTLAKIISNDLKHEIKGILTVQTDTASSILTDIEKIRHVLDEHKHPALFLVDSIACFGCDEFS